MLKVSSVILSSAIRLRIPLAKCVGHWRGGTVTMEEMYVSHVEHFLEGKIVKILYYLCSTFSLVIAIESTCY